MFGGIQFSQFGLVVANCLLNKYIYTVSKIETGKNKLKLDIQYDPKYTEFMV